MFQYRKRYEVTCDLEWHSLIGSDFRFQYRKRYEVTCDENPVDGNNFGTGVSIPQAV